MLQSTLEIDKQILGYQLKERIGSGGFGEVWSAEAPGGLMKAVKVVFGFHDGKRAQAELKALDRVKELRHPFLLSLERIEIFEGQLVVVSELADGSLADKYNQQIAAGKVGIDREDMLRYMRCAAEALDYMSGSHGLQHLDIKPENLLLVGKHVKVADFGLIKDLHQASQSLMSGMTPAYAAPELFDGRPGKFSDQYSLAIVYQEMLTGQRPFAGNTPAQLAAQHMNGRPNIKSLPASDQPIIIKALAKDPNCRFASCCELIEELNNRRRDRKKSIRRRVIDRANEDTNTLTLPTSDTGSHTHGATAVISGHSLPFQAAHVKVLDPPECSANETKVRPALIVGLGSTGGRIVQKIKTQLIARHGSMENLPSVKLIAVDSDRDGMNELLRNSTTPLTGSEIIETPLKKTETYRSQKKSHLNWLSRRWIYNIPRTLQTEGLRPLGRLAYADHFELLYQRLEDSIREISKTENLAKTADSLDIDPGETNPRVFLISSISGGIGSGMMLDLSYTIRLLMHECGFEPDSINGVLLHSTYQRMRDPGLSAANALAFLTELRHYYQLGYPGDADNGVPEFEDEAPFDFTYFEDLGQDLRQTDFDKRLDDIADYLMFSSVSKCAVFFDKCRELENQIDHFSLRTFGISVTRPGTCSAGVSDAEQVGRLLIQQWTCSGDATLESARQLSTELIQKSALNVDLVEQQTLEMVQATVHGATGRLREQVTQYLLSAKNPTGEDLLHIFDMELIGENREQGEVSLESELENAVDQEVKRLAMQAGEAVVVGLQDHLESHQLKLAAALCSCEQIRDNLQQSVEELQARSQTLHGNAVEQFHQLLQLSGVRSKGKEEWNQEVQHTLNQHINTRLGLIAQQHARSYFKNAGRSIESIQMVFDRYRRQLETVGQQFQDSGLLDQQEPDLAFSMEQLLNESIQQSLHEHVEATERLVFDSLIVEHEGYLNALQSSSIWQGKLSSEIVKQAQRVLAEAYKKVSLDKIIQHNNVPPEVLAKWLNDRMQSAKPRVNDCGGGTRLLIGMPALSNDSSLATLVKNQFGVGGRSLQGTEGSFVVCLEGEDLGLANVAFRLLQQRPDALELVRRIHTRCDIDWKSLNDLL